MELEKITTKEGAIAALEELYASKASTGNNVDEVSQWEKELNQLNNLAKKLGATELELTRVLFKGTSPEGRQALVAVYIDGLGMNESWEEFLDDARNLVTVAHEFGLKIN